MLIPHISNLIKGTKISLGAQDCHFAQNGAFTGESSIDLLKSFKCKYVIIGHSERRENNADSNFIVLKKIKNVLNNNLKPIICIGEPMELRKGRILEFFRGSIE